MMVEIFKYTERLVNTVRPRKLLVIAIGARSRPDCRGLRLTRDTDGSTLR